METLAIKRRRFSAFYPGEKPQLTLAPDSRVHLAILDAMQDYDILPSSYVKSLFSSDGYIRQRLTELQKGHYIGVPEGWSHPEKRHRVRPLEVWPRGFQYLGDRVKKRTRGNDHVNHKYLRSVIEFHRDRLAGKVTSLQVSPIDLGQRMLVPDNVWMIEYSDIEKATMYFLQEDDTGTERLRGHERFEFGRKSLRTMLQNYVQYFDDRLYERHFPTVSVLIHTTKHDRAHETIPDLIREVVPERWQPRVLIMGIPDFLSEPLLLPEPNDNMLASDYIRLRNGELERFNIMETLKATELRKRR
ncbi:hypothetical protein UNPF46_17620 [Bradyrhizobium sp. UNPF46]|uniref:hypothetical protein n=1 Tax=Bradyrhizobium sp. UNPF46 TaxID=1141168 RepID=UPI001150ED17|nr:hypothetical protein [Bradyrhizobium sp. UNPF46]TQF37932.1 hypothetical protein UNPF46_17620 [Bradyrhizobium sp. UNPF46]